MAKKGTSDATKFCAGPDRIARRRVSSCCTQDANPRTRPEHRVSALRRENNFDAVFRQHFAHPRLPRIKALVTPLRRTIGRDAAACICYRHLSQRRATFRLRSAGLALRWSVLQTEWRASAGGRTSDGAGFVAAQCALAKTSVPSIEHQPARASGLRLGTCPRTPQFNIIRAYRDPIQIAP